MRALSIVSVLLLAGLGLSGLATAAGAKDYTYKAPAAPAVAEALQTPDKPRDPETYAPLQDVRQTAAIDPTPGLIRPATRPWLSHNDDNRGFVCVDKKCKTSMPVYNTHTPLERELAS
ncbi:hypothetical protein [Asticcacaulis benevestitus]|uniref:Uncharacterized protein n=1 Tax=Asticcacaulis benevestitus DSM 16100 = ATCC BAA-896 TaxID=1121022 RepID=V4PSG0_9CAUL|nr:hypothetical protein [Asticcacaulis benevestitus]ESQ90289.1 hypothetical protein ABENE_12990 [Asticcacaulis benevestitus DSM 16100 = ATCC BAA-896]